MAALSAITAGAVPSRVLLLDRRARPHGGEGSVDGRARVVVVDDDAARAIVGTGVGPPGSRLGHMVIWQPDGVRYFPNESGWRSVFDGVVGHRRLARLVSLGSLQRTLLDRFVRLGGQSRFGEPTALQWKASGECTVGFDGGEASAELVVVAEGARAPSVAGRVKRLPVDSPPTHFVTADIGAIHTAHYGPGDLAVTFAHDRMVYGFLDRDVTSISAIVADDGNVESAFDAVRLLCSVLDSSSDNDEYDIVSHVAELSMADRCAIDGNVVMIGDSLRTSDPVSGAGANAAVLDGMAVGSYMAQIRTGLGRRAALGLLVDQLRRNTANALELSMLYGEQALFWFARRDLCNAAFRLGLSERDPGPSIANSLKRATAAAPEFFLGAAAHARSLSVFARMVGAPAPAFEAPERSARIGAIHPAGDGRSPH